MKKLSIGLLIMILSIMVIGCSKTPQKDAYNKEDANQGVDSKQDDKKEESLLTTIKNKGKLVIATSADYPPYEFHALIDGKDVIVGFDIDIAQAIADEIGVSLEVLDLDFSALEAALIAGKADILVAGINPTPERQETLDFSEIYYYASQGVITLAGKENEIETFEDLSGKVVGVQMGSIQADLAKDTSLISAPKEIKELPKINDLVMMLQTGKVDAVIMELPVAEANVRVNDKIAITPVNYVDDEGGAAVAIRKNNQDVVELVNKVIAQLIAEDKIEQFYADAVAIAEQQQ